MASAADQAFDLGPGDTILRKELHERWGGRTQGGISPSALTPNIFVFWSPAEGEKHGYYDEFRSDGCFYYTGAGLYGDQQMKDANLMLLTHSSAPAPRAVHLFAGAGGLVKYVGELEIDSNEPYYETEAPETKSGPLRKVFVFKFRLLSGQSQGPTSRLEQALQGDLVKDVPIENRWTERFYVRPSAEQYEAERREQDAVLALERYLRARGHEVGRLKIVPPGEHRPIFCDLVDKTRNVLVEAKGSVTREGVRMAIGQLIDYRRFAAPDARLAILLPERPRDDLLALLASANVTAVYPDGSGYSDGGLGLAS